MAQWLHGSAWRRVFRRSFGSDGRSVQERSTSDSFGGVDTSQSCRGVASPFCGPLTHRTLPSSRQTGEGGCDCWGSLGLALGSERRRLVSGRQLARCPSGRFLHPGIQPMPTTLHPGTLPPGAAARSCQVIRNTRDGWLVRWGSNHKCRRRNRLWRVFSGNAIGPSRSFALRLTTNF